MKKSFVYTSSLPGAEHSTAVFEQGLDMLEGKGITTIEFFSDFDLAERTGNVLHDRGLNGIYLAAAYQKRNKLSLCAPDDIERQKALDGTFRCFDAASAAGADTVLITSGYYPGIEKESASWEALSRSIVLLAERYPDLHIHLEPGDRTVDAKQLVGPTAETVAWAKNLVSQVPSASLTMDTSHIAQLFEDAYSSLKAAIPVCNHIHLANCVLKPGHQLYGDKHPVFDYPESVFTAEYIKNTSESIIALYTNEELLLSAEIINRNENELQGFEEILENLNWFFEMQN